MVVRFGTVYSCQVSSVYRSGKKKAAFIAYTRETHPPINIRLLSLLFSLLCCFSCLFLCLCKKMFAAEEFLTVFSYKPCMFLSIKTRRSTRVVGWGGLGIFCVEFAGFLQRGWFPPRD